MKIRKLLKYSVIPLSIAILYLFSFFFLKEDLGVNELIFISIILLILIISFISLTLLSFFVFFKKTEIPILIVIAIIFFQSIFPIRSVEFDSEAINTILLFSLTIGFIVLTVRSSIEMRENRYLIFLMIFGGFVFSFDFISFALTLINPLWRSGILMSVGIALFLVFSFALIFTLPNSDYLEWKKDHKLFFIKTILVPWVLILSLSVINFIVVPNSNTSKKKTDESHPFKMENYEIKLKDGME